MTAPRRTAARHRRNTWWIVVAAVFALAAASAVADQDWPRQVKHELGTIDIYQPQIDEDANSIIKVRCAVAIARKGMKEPVFGAIWMEARTTVDRDARVVTFSDIKVTRARFPDSTPDQEKLLKAIIEDAAPKWDNNLDYDRYVASIAALGKTRTTLEKFRNDPPQILVEKTPAMLLLYDGEPRSVDIQGTKLKRILNTPASVVNDPAAGLWFLYGGSGWFQAKEPMGPWTPVAKPTDQVAALIAEMEKKSDEAAKARGEVPAKEDERLLAQEAKRENPHFDPAKPPKVIPVTQPTEMILFEGEPTWALIEGDVLYADNTGSDILKDVPTQQTYLLLSGRWYRCKNLEGPWEFVPPDQLPAGFKSIPEDSPKGDVLAHVAGTPQAEEALADAQIPQVAAVKRGPAKLDVRYDGEPKFERIPDTSLEYAKNSATPVIKAGDKYYACESAVWYVASAPGGPWQVADSIPDEIMKIPPDVPVYNVKYVQVYDSSPEVVYVGYTPSYLGCYPYYGTVVWGTGYWYTPWIGSIYYPAPWSYGFHAGYSPYYGWSFGISFGYAWGWGAISIGWSNWGWGGYYPPYWGPGGYYPIYRPPYYPVGHPPHYGPRPTPHGGAGIAQLPAGGAGGRPGTLPSQPGGGARPGTLPSQPGGGARPGTLPSQPGGGAAASQLPAGGAGGRAPNLYQRPQNSDRVASTSNRPRAGSLPTTAGGAGRDNNVFTNSAGDVYRRNSNGSWDQRAGNSWKPSSGSSGLQRDYSSRQRGATRSSGYGSYRGGGGGMSRGGGGRRR